MVAVRLPTMLPTQIGTRLGLDSAAGGSGGVVFQNRQEIALTGLTASGSTPSSWGSSSYPVQISLTHQTGMASDFSDLRFVDSNDVTKLDFWIEDYTADTSATVWVEVPLVAGTSKTIYCYYNPSEAVDNESSGSATFDLFDDFDEATPTQPWFTASAGGEGSTRANTPSAQYIASRDETFVAFQGESDNPYVTILDHSNNSWSTPVKIANSTITEEDSHGAPIILADSSGTLHAFFGGHNQDPIQYYRSNSPYDPSAWTVATSNLGSSTDLWLTYPNLFELSNGDLVLFARKGDGHNNPIVYRVSTDGGDSWAAPVEILDDTLADDSWYGSFEQVGDVIHLAYCYHEHDNIPHTAADRFDQYYFRIDFSSTPVVELADGTDATANIPFTRAYLRSNAMVRDTSTRNTNAPSVFYYNSTIYIGWIEQDASDTELYHYYVSYYNSGWQAPVEIATTDHFFDRIELFTKSDGNLYAILNEDENNDFLINRRGGDANVYVSTDNGANWSLSERLLTAPSDYLMPTEFQRVRNADADFRILFAGYHRAENEMQENRRMYAWGESGFLGVAAARPNDLKWMTIASPSSYGSSEVALVDNGPSLITAMRFGANHAVRNRSKANDGNWMMAGWRTVDTREENPPTNDYLNVPLAASTVLLEHNDSRTANNLTSASLYAQVYGDAAYTLDTATITNFSGYNTYEIRRLAADYKGYQNDVEIVTDNTKYLSGNLHGIIAPWASGTTMTCDWALVRKAAETEPTATPGSTSSTNKTGIA